MVDAAWSVKYSSQTIATRNVSLFGCVPQIEVEIYVWDMRCDTTKPGQVGRIESANYPVHQNSLS